MNGLSLLDTGAALFGIAALLGLVNHHLFKLPFTIGMTFSAMLASLFVMGFDLLFPEVGVGPIVRGAIKNIDFTYALLHGMLGFLLFAGAMHTDIERLRNHAVPVLALAVVGTMLATAGMGGAAYFLFTSQGIGISLIFCMVFGALIAPTDPVAVLGIMRAAGAPQALETKVIGESLFNDGIGVVIFALLVSIATGGAGDHHHGAEAMTAGAVALLMAQEVLGGVLLGLVMGYGAYRALRSINQPNLEILISVAAVAVINMIAFKLHTSSPLACVIAGLFIGNRGRYFAMQDTTREHLDIVWSFIDEALNALLFLLVGMEILSLKYSSDILIVSLAMIPLGLGVRLVSVAVPLAGLKALKVNFSKGTTRVLTWGGLKGGISIALAMSLPEFEGRDAVLGATYAVVVFSIIVQGTTVGRLIEKLIPAEERQKPAEGGAHH
ncbi:MAG: sodium:proton antiporter [Myxococcota bacterium]|jgi:CPA1 family monovalent cation:H+ antiporter|nr:sodium:proton antiporter [Myxococcota bacterium]MEC9443054.1 sodium:proton antiporter [Myxococcota bacterium]